MEYTSDKEKWIVEVSKNAIPNEKYGFICDCGNWTFGDDVNHIPLQEFLC